MKALPLLFKLMQTTRFQPQYGYSLAEAYKSDISDLAQHHYLVTFTAWRLSRLLHHANVSISVERVLEISLIHDLGELFGGDINFYYQRANPEAKKHAKEFEAANNMFLSRFFGDEKEQYLALIQEMKEGKTVEALVAKISDIIECVHYKKVIHRLSSLDVEANSAYLGKLIDALPEPRAKEVMHRFLEGWKKEIIDDRGAVDIIQMPPSHD